jgi:flavin-dependent dehydrogenase
LREVLADAQVDGPWLAAGPIRPGIKSFARNGVFAIGNAAGEAHPLIAEGISMAIQSAFLLCGALRERNDARDAGRVARSYARAWRRQFAPRVHAAAAFARLATDARTRPTAIAALRALPSMLTLGARWSGKASAFRGMRDPA